MPDNQKRNQTTKIQRGQQSSLDQTYYNQETQKGQTKNTF